MAEIRLKDISSDQIDRALALAMREAGIPEYRNSPALREEFLIAAIAQSSILTILRADAEGREVRP